MCPWKSDYWLNTQIIHISNKITASEPVDSLRVGEQQKITLRLFLVWKWEAAVFWTIRIMDSGDFRWWRVSCGSNHLGGVGTARSLAFSRPPNESRTSQVGRGPPPPPLLPFFSSPSAPPPPRSTPRIGNATHNFTYQTHIHISFN